MIECTIFPVYLQHMPWRVAWTILKWAFLIICMPLYEIWDQNMKGGDCGDWFVPFPLPSDVDEEALSEREEAGRTDVAVPLIMRKRRWGLASLKTTGIQCADILNPKYWAPQKNLVKGCRETLDYYCVSCKLLSASKADALLFVNILVSGKFHGCFAQRLAVNKPCLQIVIALLFVNMVCLPLIAEQNAHEIFLTQ